jgi:hypothetical protein
VQVNFMQAPGVFFTGFRTGPGGPPGGSPRWGPGPAPYDDVIDAEVVEDDDDHGPPELHAPH